MVDKIKIFDASPPAPDPDPESSSGRDGRQRWLDNPRVLIVAAVLLLSGLAGLFWLSDQTENIPLTVLTGVLLSALLAVDAALIAALLFVLARNLIKLFEKRQPAPFARFRTKLVLALLAMTILPAVLVLISGSEIINRAAERWLSEPVDQVLSAANAIAGAFYRDHLDATAVRADRLRRTLPAPRVAEADVAALDPIVRAEVGTMPNGLVEIYRVSRSPSGQPDVQFVLSFKSLPAELRVSRTDRLAAQTVASKSPAQEKEDLDSGAVLVRTAMPILDADTRAAVGAVVVSELIATDVNAMVVFAQTAHQSYKQKLTFKRPLQGLYLTIFVTVTLLILVSATWFGLYLAKRITRPVQRLAEGARAIGAGRLDFRLEPETGDELGSLVEAFNMMAAELRTSQEKLEQSRVALERTHLEVDARRRYIETILERVATGVISLDASGHITTVNAAAERLLGLGPTAIGQPVGDVLRREDLQPLLPLVEAAERREPAGVVQEVMLAREEREVHLAAAGTVLLGDGGRPEGTVLVLDDVTPLIRAQRVAAWRDVARRLAHEIKNPLTPIQLSAERLRRHFAPAAPATRALVDECTGAIVAEVEALKGLVDEFAQFARLRGPRMLPADLNRLVSDTLRLYAGVLQFGHLRVEQRLEPSLPGVRLDAEQMRQVIINLVDNALEALGGPMAPVRPDGHAPTIVVATAHDARNGIVRVTITDNGPGVPTADRDKLFMPYYSTKGRGSGLGLAIVRRIIVEHGGGIEVRDAQPSGTAFVVELPAA
jgi:two-component system nitrogen regulation sensor histidine kinase NtrY